MQLELFTFDEIKECFANTCNALLRETNYFLKKLDCRCNYVIDCYCNAIHAFRLYYFGGRHV